MNQKPSIGLKHYEELESTDFKIETINTHRKKRDVNNSTVENILLTTTKLNFHAFDRDFIIFLKRDLNLVSDKVDVEVRYSNNKIEHINNYFTSNNYIGFVDGEPQSSVTCYIEQFVEPNQSITYPLIYAQIRLENDDKKEYFYIEPIFLKENSSDKRTKYIIYRTDDIASDVLNEGVFKYIIILI